MSSPELVESLSFRGHYAFRGRPFSSSLSFHVYLHLCRCPWQSAASSHMRDPVQPPQSQIASHASPSARPRAARSRVVTPFCHLHARRVHHITPIRRSQMFNHISYGNVICAFSPQAQRTRGIRLASAQTNGNRYQARTNAPLAGTCLVAGSAPELP